MSPFVLLLKKQFDSSRIKNPRYSLRSYASMLGISPSSLSKVLNDKQMLTELTIRKLAKKLKVDPQATEEFVSASGFKTNEHLKKAALSGATKALEMFDVFANWYHFAILEWIRIQNGLVKVSTISNNFRLPKKTVETSIELLERYGLIEVDNSASGRRYIVHEVSRKFGDSAPNNAIREYHGQLIAKAARSLQEDQANIRNISSSTIAVSNASYEKIVEEIKKFRMKVGRIADQDTSAEAIYALNLQLIPLTFEKP